MKIIDTHCDALYKLQYYKRQGYSLNFTNSPLLDVNYERLKTGKVALQFFAIFIDADVPTEEKWRYALEQIELFHREVIGKHPNMKHIKNWADIRRLKQDEIGAVLTLEGAEAFGNDLNKLNLLYELGILSIGLAWNDANLCIDGAEEPRGAGLTRLGRQVIQLNNEHSILSDVSHASEQGFWDILEHAQYPFASHSNARALCDHPRNLTDTQMEHLFAKGGFMHLVFFPPFINETGDVVTIKDIINHIDHICALGGIKKIGFGSDFDGIDDHVEDLEHVGKYQNLINELLKHYSEDDVRGFAYRNFLNHVMPLDK